ncbi:MAG: aspartyl/glutamyl-tRNA amidotransferase subunit A, partial [Candidatus Yanofskybacteria bacterium GW2011_GWE1_40_10]
MPAKGHTIESIVKGIRNGQFSAKEIFNEYLAKIKVLDKDLHAYLSMHEFQEPRDGVLFGVPSAIKDNILIAGTICTAGSKILEKYVSAYDATIINKLRSAGSVFLGKTNLDEFAMGSSTENSAYGPTKNPLDTTRVPGGSSGGSAAAVAADLAVFSIGSDTAGSIRQPASFCGTVGLKPTYGRVSRHGLIAMTSSLDQIGPFTKNVRDAALLMNVISGHDMFDSTTVPKKSEDFLLNIDKSVKGLRVGVPAEFFGQGLDKEVKDKIMESIERLAKLGCEIKEVSLPHSKYSIAAYYIVA